jgi:hypothetical protein
MVSWPDLGTRVTVRYRRRPGSIPPLTDAVGHLLAVDPVVRVRTKTGAVVECTPADVVALRILTDAPVRTSEIRALEHAAAAAWPATEHSEQTWLDGWLLRAEPGAEIEANSAVPLDISARPDAIGAIVAWYADRGLIPRLAIPDRLLRVPGGLAAEREERILVRDVPEGHASVSLDNERPVGVSLGEFAVVTDAPDGTRWVGLSAIRAVAEPAGPSCEALLVWGAQRGATRGYVRVGDHDTHAIALAESLGFRLHHRLKYFRVMSGPLDSL